MMILNRIFMFVYALFNIFIGVCVLLIATRKIELDMIKDHIEPFLGSVGFIAGATIFIVLSFIALLVSMYSGGQKKIMVSNGVNGEVYMSVGAIGKIVERIVDRISGLSNIKVDVAGSKSYIKIIINADATADCKVAEVSALVQENVKAGLSESLEREINRVDVRIKDVKQPL